MTKERREELREAIRHGYGALAFYQLPTAEELRDLLDSDERLEQKQVRIVVLEEQIAALPKAWKGRAEDAEARLKHVKQWLERYANSAGSEHASGFASCASMALVEIEAGPYKPDNVVITGPAEPVEDEPSQ